MSAVFYKTHPSGYRVTVEPMKPGDKVCITQGLWAGLYGLVTRGPNESLNLSVVSVSLLVDEVNARVGSRLDWSSIDKRGAVEITFAADYVRLV
jgi:hypothetical protein